MENLETGQGSQPSLAMPGRGMVQPSGHPGQVSESARPSKYQEHPSKSPRRRREGKRSQRRGGGHEQMLQESERRRLPSQHEHPEPSGSAIDTAESSPKRFAKCCRLPAGQLRRWHSSAALEMRWWLSNIVLTSLPVLPLTGEPTFFMDRIQPLTLDPKPAFFPTQLQSCKHAGVECKRGILSAVFLWDIDTKACVTWLCKIR